MRGGGEVDDMKERLIREGYERVRQTRSGQWVGVMSFIYTSALCIGLDEHGYERRYCYERKKDALIACDAFDGQGDPIGPWIKMKSVDGDKMNTQME